MCFSPSCICSSSCSGSLWSLPHYWTLSSLITQFHHFNLLLRELSSKTAVNACRVLTDNLYIFGFKQSWVKTAASPVDISWFQSRFCSAMVLQCWILCCLISIELSQGLWVSTKRRTSVWPNGRCWECCHSLQWATIPLQIYSLPTHSQGCLIPRLQPASRGDLLVCLQTGSEQHHLHKFSLSGSAVGH